MATRLLDRPVRPKPDYFGPDGAPPGIVLALDSYETLNDGTKWLASRPTITPNTLVAHTNGASVEATTESSINHGLRGLNNTKPHYCLGDVPTKTLATDKRGIANSTGSSIEAEYGVRDSSYWSIAVETADLGSIEAKRRGIAWAADCGPFLHDNADDLAHIIAYESIVWGFPIRVSPSFTAGGVVAHTWPYPYPHFTTVPGKTCPGSTKIADLRDEIIPRAQQIRAAWTSPTQPPEVIDPPEDDMARYARYANWDNQMHLYSVSAETKKRNGDQYVEPAILPAITREQFIAIHGFEPTPHKG